MFFENLFGENQLCRSGNFYFGKTLEEEQQ
jgi:hypothetical protein